MTTCLIHETAIHAWTTQQVFFICNNYVNSDQVIKSYSKQKSSQKSRHSLLRVLTALIQPDCLWDIIITFSIEIASHNGIHYVHIDPCQLRNCNYVIVEYACAKYLGVGKNDCVNTKQERVIVNTKRKQGMVVCAGWLTPNAHAQMDYASAMGCPTDIKLMYNVMY